MFRDTISTVFGPKSWVEGTWDPRVKEGKNLRVEPESIGSESEGTAQEEWWTAILPMLGTSQSWRSCCCQCVCTILLQLLTAILKMLETVLKFLAWQWCQGMDSTVVGGSSNTLPNLAPLYWGACFLDSALTYSL